MLGYKPTMQRINYIDWEFMTENLTFSKRTISTQNENMIGTCMHCAKCVIGTKFM